MTSDIEHSRAARARACNVRIDPGDIEALIGAPRPTLPLTVDNPGERVVDWLREHGCDEIVAACVPRPVRPALMVCAEAAPRFVAWMREMGYAGIWTDKELRVFLAEWHIDQNVAALPPADVVRHVRHQLGVYSERVRLKARGEGDGRVTRWIIDDVAEPELMAA